jgi:hypothetical protein
MNPVSRRQFCGTVLASAAALNVKGQSYSAMLHAPTEWTFESNKSYADPFNDGA